MPPPEISTLQLLGIPLLSWLLWVALKRAFRKDPFASIPGPDGGSFLLGHIPSIFNAEKGFQFHENVVAEHDQVARLKGPFKTSQLFVSDPKALHQVLVKDHAVVWNFGLDFNESNLAMFGPGLLSVYGPDHRKQRKLLNSVFSTSQLRSIATTFDEVSAKLADTLSGIVGKERKEVELSDWLTRGALEVIGQGALGYSFDTLLENSKPHPFATSVKLLFRLWTDTIVLQSFFMPLVRKYNIGGKPLQRFVMSNLTWGSVKKLNDVVNLMHQTSLEIYEGGKQFVASGGEKNVLSALILANSASAPGERMSDEEVIAQISTIAFAGMDTTSGALSRLLWLLSEHQDVQDRLRAEIREAKEQHDQISYDELMALPYLDAVCKETMRLYPPAPIISRFANQDTVLPLSSPLQGRDGKQIEQVFVPAGTNILISLVGSNRNKKFWGPDAGEWKPERWLRDLPQSLLEAKVPGIYSHLLTFAGGGKSCVGVKFAELEMKYMMLNILHHLKLSPGRQTIAWNYGAVVTPSVKPDNVRPELPLVLEHVE